MAKCATREAYGKALAQLIQENERVIVLDADLAGSTKTSEAKKVCPQRHFDVGIAEGNMMGIAAGLAASKYIVFASSFAMFAAGRAYEQIRNAIGYPHLNVKICATHAGLSVGEDGATHQCNEDLALMRTIPGMCVLQPCDAQQTTQMIKAIARMDGPCYVRLSRMAVDTVYDENMPFTIGKGNVLQKGEKVAIVASGIMVQEALQAAKQLPFVPTIVDMHTIKPIDKALLCSLAKDHQLIVTAEEHSIIGGLGSAVAEVLAQQPHACALRMVGVFDVYGESGTPQDVLHKYGIDAKTIVNTILTQPFQ